MRKHLQELVELLHKCGEQSGAQRVTTALAGTEADFQEFLTSNTLWGGAGSIADQAGDSSGARSEARRDIEQVLVRLGREQIRSGHVNERTAMWVDAFEKWARNGI